VKPTTTEWFARPLSQYELARYSVPRRPDIVDDRRRREPVIGSDPALHSLERVRWVRVEADLCRGGERMHEVDESLEEQEPLGR